MTDAARRAEGGADAWGRRHPASDALARHPSPWFDRRGRPRTARRSGRVALAAALVVAALIGFATFALAADISNHTVLSNGVPEHHGTLDDAVWIPPADLSWDVPPPSPTLDDARPDHRPAAVDPPPRSGVPAPPGPTTPTPTPSSPTSTSTTSSPTSTSTTSSPTSTSATSGPSTSSSPTSPPPTSSPPTSTPTTSTPTTSTPTTSTRSTVTSTTGATTAVVTPDTASAVAAMNDARAGAGCTSLRVDARLADSAREHAEELAAGTGDSGAAARMIGAGYPTPGGENVARGQSSLTEATAELLASASHRANVVDCTFSAVGLAHAAGAQGDYWVQDFGR